MTFEQVRVVRDEFSISSGYIFLKYTEEVPYEDLEENIVDGKQKISLCSTSYESIR